MKPRSRRWMRRLGQLLLGALGLLALGAAVAFRPLDTGATPVPAGVISHEAPAATALRASWARARLTPTLGATEDDPAAGAFRQLPLAGYGNRQGAPATGVHDDLWVKAIAFESGGTTGVVVTADALIIPREIGDAAAATLAREFGLGREQVYFSATHTHCSLGGWGQRFVGEAFAGPFNPGVRIWFARQLAQAATDALRQLAPAALGQGSFAAPEFIRNRLVGDAGRADPEFSLLVVRKTDGTRAVLGSYSAHATVLGGDMMQYSADYPGVWQRTVEAAGVEMAAFLAGGVGSQGPRAPRGGLEGIDAMGGALAARTLETLPRIPLDPAARFGVRMATVTLPDLQVRVTDSVRLNPWVGRRLMPPLNDSTFLQAFTFGSGVWLSTPCDYSGELALELKEAAAAAGRRAVVTSFNGDYVGYVIPARYYSREGYEPRVMNFYGPHVSTVFAETLARLAVGGAATTSSP